MKLLYLVLPLTATVVSCSLTQSVSDIAPASKTGPSKVSNIKGIPIGSEIYKNSLRFNKKTEKLFDLEKEADIVVNYNFSEKFDIGIGESKDGIHYPQDHDIDELKSFFDGLNHKDLVVVIICKNSWSISKIDNKVTMLKDYFIDRGFKRISIQQASCSGRGEYLDYTKPTR